MQKPLKMNISVSVPALILCVALLFCSTFVSVYFRLSGGIPSDSTVNAGGNVTVSNSGDYHTEPKEPSVKITIAGDVLIHKSVYSKAKQADGSYNFKPYFSLLGNAFDGDLNIANMEGPVNAHGDNKFIATYPCFNAPAEILDALKEVNINTLLTSNNHSFDMQWNGLVKTRQNILDKGFYAVGTYATQEQYDTPFIREINGIKIGIAAFTDSTNGMNIPKEHRGYALNRIFLDDSAIPKLHKRVEQLREAGAEYIIVSLHWGAEYQDAPSAAQKKLAQALVDDGVDLIIGNHAHCVQPIRRIKTTYMGKEKESIVIYSMGNFFVNQTAQNKPKTQQGMVVKLNIQKDSDGAVILSDASYTPTLMYYTEEAESDTDAMRIIAAGAYANADTKPDFFVDEEEWKQCSAAIAHVKKIAGSEIECRETF